METLFLHGIILLELTFWASAAATQWQENRQDGEIQKSKRDGKELTTSFKRIFK
jgi:hypothetical protein